MRELFEPIGRWWCRIAHQEISRPHRGEYQCLVCLRRYPVLFEPRSKPAAPTRTVVAEEVPSAVRLGVHSS